MRSAGTTIGKGIRVSRSTGGFAGPLVGLAALCVESSVGCGEFGLPVYSTPEVEEASSPTIQADILDIDPKLGRQGQQGLVMDIYGLNTSFSNASVVSFPDEPAIVVAAVEADGLELLHVTLDIGSRSAVGVHSLQVTTERDGTMEYRDGFTVVE